MTPVIAGGTVAHRQLLEEILARLGRTEIRKLALEEFLVTPAPAGDLPTPEQARAASGVSVRLVEPTNPDLRTEWHTGLAAVALRAAAARSGLEQVVLLELPRSGTTLQHVRAPEAPLTDLEIGRMRVQVAAATLAAGASLEELAFLQPLGHAWVARLRVEEPHEFLRRQLLGTFYPAVQTWRERCANQAYIEVCDHRDEPVFTSASTACGGRDHLRADLECCSPFIHIGGFHRPLRPDCPVFG